MSDRAAPVAGADDRAPQVREMFEQLAPRYDLANRVLSLGLDQWWRRQAIAALGDCVRGDMLDLCAGTMDLSVMLLDRGARHVHAIDFSESMLEAGAGKFAPDAPVTRTPADARELPLPDASVDGIICGFGLRNVPGVEDAVRECARVLRPGGRVVVLDFFQPEWWLPRLLQGTYNRFVLPTVGGMITGFGDAYAYLASSIDAFETRTDFQQMMERHGLRAEGRDMFPPVAGMAIGVKESPDA